MLPFSSRLKQALVVAAFGVTGCTYSNGDPADATPTPCGITPQSVTYAGVISPIFDARCRECHGTSVATQLGGGNDLGSYQAIKRFPASSILGSIKHEPGNAPMPKGRAKLSDCEISRIEAWIAAGRPEN